MNNDKLNLDLAKTIESFPESGMLFWRLTVRLKNGSIVNGVICGHNGIEYNFLTEHGYLNSFGPRAVSPLTETDGSIGVTYPGEGTVLGAVPGVFGANGFYSSVEQQILTKMANGTIQNVASTTAQNIFANEVQTGLPSIGVDLGQEVLSSLFGEQPTTDSSSSGSAYLQGPLGGKH